MKNLKFSKSPRPARLAQIKEWLKLEEEEEGSGFYCNWRLIEEAFNDKSLYCVTTKDETLAFCTFRVHCGIRCYLAITETHPGYRSKGIGRYLINHFLEAMNSQGVEVIWGECAPASSKTFWKHMGFKEIPNNIDNNTHNPYDNKAIYKSSGESEIPNNETEGNEGTLELWEHFTWDKKDNAPSWRWPLNATDGKLLKPIIHPANRKWIVVWRKKGKILRESEIRNFSPETQKCSNFLVLTTIPEL